MTRHSTLALLAVLAWVHIACVLEAEEMQYPLAVVSGTQGEIYVADRNLPGIWKVVDGQATIYFQGSKTFRTPLNAVRCLAVGSDGTLYAGDSSTREVYRFDKEAKPEPLTKGYIGIPMGIAIDSKGDLLVADIERHSVFRVSPSRGEVTEFTRCSPPRGIAIDAQDRVWILANVKNSLVRYSPDKKEEVIVEGTPFEFPNQLTLDAAGNAYLCDGYAKSVWKVAATGGKPEKLIGGEPLKNPVGISWAANSLLVADPHAKGIFVIDLEKPSLKPVFP
jgi:sugar lactone lactonase YvrE